MVQTLIVGSVVGWCGRPWDEVNLSGIEFTSFLESCTAVAFTPWSWTTNSLFIAATGRLDLRDLRDEFRRGNGASGALKFARHRWQLNKRGIFFSMLLGSGYGVHGMDKQQFTQFMEGFGKFIQRQEVVGQATTNLEGSRRSRHVERGRSRSTFFGFELSSRCCQRT